MAKYQKYAEYKDSGIEWLGEIPKSWNISRLKYIAEIFGRIGFRGYTVDDIVDEGEGALVLSPSNILGDQFSLDKKTYLSWKKYYESPEIMVGINDILLVKTGSTYGKSTIILEKKEPMTINPQMALLKKIKLESRFLYYLFQSTLYKAVIDISNTGSGMPTMTQENINSFPIPFPAFNEALNIANFLDHETAKIDNLIAKQEKLIELLKEKRQAVISHAVTKGLIPNAPMKDSGVEWLGEVPEHWVVSRFKYTSDRVIVGIAEAATHAYSESGVPIIRSTNIKEEGLMTENILFIKQNFADDNASKYIYENDIVTVRTGYPGISSVVPKEMNKSHCFTNLVSTPKKSFNPYFLNEYLNSDLGKAYFELLGWGSAQKNISVPILQEFPIAFPEQQEQEIIVQFIRQQRFKFTELISKAEKNIKLMRERRTALISAAVTGKIDVRHWHNPNKNNNQNNMELSA